MLHTVDSSSYKSKEIKEHVLGFKNISKGIYITLQR